MRLQLRTDIAYVVVTKWAFPFGPTSPLSCRLLTAPNEILPATDTYVNHKNAL